MRGIDLTQRFRYARASIIFLFLFYLVGVTGILYPATHNLFLTLTKFALLLNFLLLMLFHEQKFSKNTSKLYASIFLVSFLIEVLGVNTGAIFGHYSYGKGLGLKLFNTPLLIGLNWLMLSYSFYVVLSSIKLLVWVRACLGAIGMLLYDLLLEQSATKLDMWYWQNNHIPFQNYLAWFIVALLIQFLLLTTKTSIKNKLALPTLIAQILFFLVLFIVKLSGNEA